MIEILNSQSFGSPSRIVFYTGTNDSEQSTLESCSDNVQLMIEIAAQKYPSSKVLISSLITQSDDKDSLCLQLNGKLGALASFPNVHVVNNSNITKKDLFDNKHIKRRKIGLLVSNLKDVIFNRLNKSCSSIASRASWGNTRNNHLSLSYKGRVNVDSSDQPRSYTSVLKRLTEPVNLPTEINKFVFCNCCSCNPNCIGYVSYLILSSFNVIVLLVIVTSIVNYHHEFFYLSSF